MSPMRSVKRTCPFNEPACLETRHWVGSVLPAGLLDLEGVWDARVLAIGGSTPEADAYPFQRSLFYAYRQPPDPAVKAFLGMALSEEGKTRIATSIKGP